MSKTYNSNIGTFAGSWEIQRRSPLDSRDVVDTLGDLTTPSTWYGKDGKPYHYKGMSTKIAATGEIYVYIGESGNETQVASMDYWVKSGGGSTYTAGDGIKPTSFESNKIEVEFAGDSFVDTLSFESEETTMYTIGDQTNYTYLIKVSKQTSGSNSLITFTNVSAAYEGGGNTLLYVDAGSYYYCLDGSDEPESSNPEIEITEGMVDDVDTIEGNVTKLIIEPASGVSFYSTDIEIIKSE